MSIADARPGAAADFVLCSHVFYYVPPDQWRDTLHTLAGWLRPGGVLAIALQNHETDCMRMLRHFTGRQFDLGALGRSYASETAGAFDLRIDTVAAHVDTDSFASAYMIAEFMLNLLPLPTPPERAALERYVQNHFQQGGRYRFSCHQDFLRLERRGDEAGDVRLEV